MRKMILILLLLPCMLSAKNYKYNSVHIFQQGDDYFALDKALVNKTTGEISLNGHNLTIDHKKYVLKHYGKDKGIYKSKGCFFKLVYYSGELVYVQQLKFGRVYKYNIMNENTVNKD